MTSAVARLMVTREYMAHAACRVRQSVHAFLSVTGPAIATSAWSVASCIHTFNSSGTSYILIPTLRARRIADKSDNLSEVESNVW